MVINIKIITLELRRLNDIHTDVNDGTEINLGYDISAHMGARKGECD